MRGGGNGSIFPGSLILGARLAALFDMKFGFSVFGNPKLSGFFPPPSCIVLLVISLLLFLPEKLFLSAVKLGAPFLL